ncbi:hypothetical protein AMATHDRAFT_7677 [Amanita thiersii Skay4041]|uniref:Uncharacterized protein n=1 Tax=Amanita thiersii Skay4041 TaxID=703135 RepID=A0A2A9NB62_9AGAR|nr:hypothetical protein AMATHDRAFT_7677 [Amanita thiersii Skay4041]
MSIGFNYFYEDTASSKIQYNKDWMAKRNVTSNSTYHTATPGAACFLKTRNLPVKVVGFIEGLPGDEWTFEFTIENGLPNTRILRSDGTRNHRLFYQTPRLGPSMGTFHMKLTSSPNITDLDEDRGANLVGFMVPPELGMDVNSLFIDQVRNNATRVTYSPGWGAYSGSDRSFKDLYIPPSQGVATLMFNGTGVLPIVSYNYSHPFNIVAYIDNEIIPPSNFTPRLLPDSLTRPIVQNWPLFQSSGLSPELHNLTIVYTSPQNDTIPSSQFAFGLDYFSVLTPLDHTSMQDESGISAGAKGGIAVSAISFVCLIILCIFFWNKRRSRKQRTEDVINPFQNSEPTVITNLLKGSFGREHQAQTMHLHSGFRTKRTNAQLGPTSQVAQLELPSSSSSVLNEANAPANVTEQNPKGNGESSSRRDASGERSGVIDEPPAYQEHA